MKPKQLLYSLISAIALTALLMIFDLLGGRDTNIITYSWQLLSYLLISGILGFYIAHNRNSSFRLWFSTFLVFYVIGYFNVIIEAYIFNVMDRSISGRIMLLSIPYTLLGSLLIVWIHGGMKKKISTEASFQLRKGSGWTIRILSANFLYIVFYLAAGITVQNLTPGFSEYYEGKLPSLITFFITNMFFRGFIFVGIAILIDRTLHGNKLTKAIFTGLVFSIIGGIAPLIPPSDYMPDFIRIAHGFEVGISNFLYGLSILLILRSRQVRSSPIRVH